MPEKKHVEDEVRELDKKEAALRTEQMSDEEILEFIKTHPEFHRYVDRRVTEGIKTFAANQKKKEGKENKNIAGDTGEEAEGEIKKNAGSITEPAAEKYVPEDAKQLALENEMINKGEQIEQQLATRGLQSFAGLIQDESLIDDLELAAAEFLRSKNMGADVYPQKTISQHPNLNPLEMLVAQRLGIGLSDYAKQKIELEQKEVHK